MTITKTQNSQIVQDSELKALGKAARSTNESILSGINAELDTPLRLHASFPVADSKLNLSAGTLETSDGANRSVAPLKKIVYNIPQSSIDFQTQTTTGVFFDVTWPSYTSGNYCIAGFTLLETGSVQVIFSAESLTLGALENPGAMFADNGTPLGYLILQSTGSGFKTAGSASNIIENAQIYRFASGAGGGSGTATGNADSFTESLKIRLNDSYYQYVTPVAFETVAGDLTLTASAAYNGIDSTYDFDAGENIVSKNLFCEEFILAGDLASKFELHAEWFSDVSRDNNALYEIAVDGVNFETITMIRQGLSNKFTGQLTSALPPVVTLADGADGSSVPATTTLGGNLSTTQALAKSFTLTENYRLTDLIGFSTTVTGTPSGLLTISVVKDNAGSPTGDVVFTRSKLISEIIAQGSYTAINGISAGLPAGTYWVVFSTDAAYKTSFSAGVTEIKIGSFSDTVPSLIGTTQIRNLAFLVKGYKNYLSIRVTASASATKLKAFGVFYKEVGPYPVSQFQALQKFIFSGDDDVTSFQVTNFYPNADFLKVYDINSGQVYRYPYFNISGRTVTFEAGSFLSPGDIIELIFDQADGSSYDYSNTNLSIITENHLGSSSATLDKSLSGRGILLRAEDGTLLELWVDKFKNLQLTLPKG